MHHCFIAFYLNNFIFLITIPPLHFKGIVIFMRWNRIGTFYWPLRKFGYQNQYQEGKNGVRAIFSYDTSHLFVNGINCSMLFLVHFRHAISVKPLFCYHVTTEGDVLKHKWYNPTLLAICLLRRESLASGQNRSWGENQMLRGSWQWGCHKCLLNWLIVTPGLWFRYAGWFTSGLACSRAVRQQTARLKCWPWRRRSALGWWHEGKGVGWCYLYLSDSLQAFVSSALAHMGQTIGKCDLPKVPCTVCV